MHLAIVVISAVLSFLLSYIKEFEAPQMSALLGGCFAFVGARLKTACLA